MAFLVSLAMNQDDIIMDVLSFNLANLRISGSCVKGNGKNHLIACGQVSGVIKSGQQRTHFIIAEGLNKNLGFLLHSYLVGGICIDVFLLDSEVEECTQTF